MYIGYHHTNQLLLIFAIILSFTPVTRAQQNNNEGKNLNYVAQRKSDAVNYILQLHKGALLVRLETRKNSIEALRKAGKRRQADQLEAEQRELNLSYISAFVNGFDFCPVYFFHSDHSTNIINGHLEDVVFLNEKSVADPSIRPELQYFLTAEFGTVKTLGFSGLVIKNGRFQQLDDPFPFYVRTYHSLFVRRKPEIVVKIMNEKLHRFYDKYQD